MSGYVYPRLSRWDFGIFRLLGPGLGNLLFPWARAIVAARQYGLVPIWPTWPQLKIGPLLRGESDLRFYSGLFRNPGYYVDGAEKLWILTASRTHSEDSLARYQQDALGRGRILLRFAGMNGLFSPFVEQRAMVREELLRMSHPEHLCGLSHDFRNSITVHIRLGDFLPFDDASMRAGQHNMQLPIGWVVDTIKVIRGELGQDIPVWVFSDGRDSELRKILDMPGVTRLRFGSGLADMLAMSQSNVLIVASTFSMWSAFLGAVPSVYYPGQLRQALMPQHRGFEVEWEPGSPPERSILEAIEKRRDAAPCPK